MGNRMKLALYSKSGACIGDVYFDGEAVPRVGEVVDLAGYPAENLPFGEVTSFFVEDVIWAVDGARLIAHLTCRQWHEGDRRLELETRGWL